MAEYGETELNYNEYLKVPELLRLQHCLSRPPAHDELQFIIVHQTYELWFKLILFEIESAIASMDQDNVRYATGLIGRINTIQRVLYQQIHVLETMSPREFLQFRDNLKPASGFQSVQFREIEFLSNLKDESVLVHLKSDPESLERLRGRLSQPTLWDAFLKLMKRQGFDIPENDTEKLHAALLRLHEENEKYYDLYLLSEALVEYDELLGLWRLHHVRMVERMIGNKIGTGGSLGVQYLMTTVGKKCFPALWEIRTLL